MKILYLGCHEILEYDEVKLLTEMGHEVFSLGGVYQNGNQGGTMRGEIPNLYENSHLRSVALQCSKENIHQELLDWMDVCLVMHNSRVDINDHPQPWLKNNWEKFKASGKPIVWRSIGQSNRQIEEALKEFRKDGLKIIRYSPREDSIPGYQGSDAMIRFYKDPEEYKDYNGQIRQVVNLSQALFGNNKVASRGDHMSKPIFDKVMEGFDWKVFGPDNENAGEHNGGQLSHSDLKQMLKFNRVFFFTGTRPASYTLAFMEAMMTGIPIVSIGPDHGNEVYTDQKTFECHELLGAKDGLEGGFWSDNVKELKEYIEILLKDPNLALNVGQRGRARAIELFGKENVGKAWKSFLATL